MKPCASRSQGTCSALTEGSDGILYGTTFFGGTSGAGTIYKLNKDGGSYTVLHGFAESSVDGAMPSSSLVEGKDGALYGTTQSGGSSGGAGTVFKLNKDGSGYTVIYSLSPTNHIGAVPAAGLLQLDGTFYGTTLSGGDMFQGTLFKLVPSGM